MNSKQVPRRSPAAARLEAEGEGSQPDWALMSQWWAGLPWVNPWMAWWTSMWAGWLGQGPYGPPGTNRRSEDTPPWLPSVQAAIIPLRRHTDRPGQQADRLSMRVRTPNLPWLGGGNVIAFDAVVPRARQAEPPSGDG